ncbi:LysR substrate-binding domain-containing protein [Bradyrhizobium guangdongense]
MDRLTSMAVFVAAAEEGSLVAAARRFGLSASMAGKHVASLEAELKVRLMQRSTRSLVMTEAGRAYYVRSKRILEEYEEARREVADSQTMIRGVLRVAAPLTFGEMHLSGLVASYMARYPEVLIDIILGDGYVDLLADNIDVAIRIGQLRNSDLIARRLAPCPMVFCAAPSFLDVHGLPGTIEDLRLAPRLAFSDAVSAGDWTILDAVGSPQVIDGPIRLRANNMAMLLSAVLSGAGVAYGPSFVFGPSIAAGRLVRLLPQYRSVDLAVHAVYPTNRHVTLKLRSFVDHLISALGGRPPWDDLGDHS